LDLTAYPVAVLVVFGMFTFAALAIVVGIRRADDDQQERINPKVPAWVGPLALLLAGSLLAAILILGGEAVEESATRPPSQSADRLVPASPGPTTDGPEEAPSPALGALLSGLALVLLGALVAGAVLRSRRNLTIEFPEPPSVQLLKGVDAALVDVESIHDPRLAVIACYARLLRALDKAGVARRRSDTPTELLRRMLDDRRVPHDSIALLTELFQTARFSNNRIDEAMRRTALVALQDIRSRLEAAT
jgi:hypothetical protein